MVKLAQRVRCWLFGHEIEATQLCVTASGKYERYPPGPVFVRCYRCGKNFLPTDSAEVGTK